MKLPSNPYQYCIMRLFVQALFIIWLGASSPYSYASQKSIFFYNPDANLRNIGRLKGVMEKYLKKISPDLTFQPFLKFDIFLKEVKKKKPSFIIISSLHLPILNHDIKYYPVLIPLVNGTTKYKKVLITKDMGSVKGLSGRKLATANLGKDGKKIFDNILFESTGVKTDGIGIIWVSKDIDAILALSFGQVDYALVSPANIEILRKSSPMMVKDINIVASTPEIFNTPLCIAGNKLSLPEIGPIIEGFRNMNKDPYGREALKTFNYQKWIDVTKDFLDEFIKGQYEH